MRQNNKLGFVFMLPAVLFLLVFLLLPIIFLIITSFKTSGNSITIGNQLSIENFKSIFTSSSMYRGIFRTLIVATVVSITCIVLAYFPAYALTKVKGNKRTFLYVILLSPLLTSVVVRTYSWIVILSNNGIVNQTLLKLNLIKQPMSLMWGNGALIIAFVQVLLPYAIIFIANSLSDIDNGLIRAANNLGASKIKIFFTIILPLTVPGITNSFTLIFSLTAGSYVTPLLIAGPQKQVMALTIYQQAMQIMNLPLAAALSIILLVVVIIVVTLVNYFGRRWEVKVYGK